MFHGEFQTTPQPRIKARKPKTNWNMVIWPILMLWLAAYVYVQHSEYKEDAATVLPGLMILIFFVVLLLNGLAGSHQERRLELEALDETITHCSKCHRGDVPLYAMEIHSYACAFWIVQFNNRGRFCADCARKLASRAFVKTCFYSILCPPFIGWAWFEKRSILKRVSAKVV